MIPYADSHKFTGTHARVAEALPGAAGSLFHVRLESQRAFEHGRVEVDCVHFLVRPGTTMISCVRYRLPRSGVV